jgi:hypothetical protein
MILYPSYKKYKQLQTQHTVYMGGRGEEEEE